MKKRTYLLGLILWLLAGSVHATLTHVQYAFATTIQSVDPGATGFPAELATVSVGDKTRNCGTPIKSKGTGNLMLTTDLKVLPCGGRSLRKTTSPGVVLSPVLLLIKR